MIAGKWKLQVLCCTSTICVFSLVVTALKFICHAPFINPSWTSPDIVVVDKDHLIWADSRMKAIFFTMDCVSACNLITPAAGISNSTAAKKLLLFLIEGLFQDTLDFFGVKFKVSQAAGQLSNGVVTFLTKKEGHAIYPSSSGKFLLFNISCNVSLSLCFQMLWEVQRRKGCSRSPLLALLICQVIPCRAVFYWQWYIQSTIFYLFFRCLVIDLYWICQVPIYDATDGFKFNVSDLSQLWSLPLFRKGLYDLPPYAVITVGYTVTSKFVRYVKFSFCKHGLHVQCSFCNLACWEDQRWRWRQKVACYGVRSAEGFTKHWICLFERQLYVM